LQQDVDELADVASLMSWADEDGLGTESSARMAGQPGFDRAAHALAANMLDAGAGNDALDGIFKDAGRYVCAMWAMYAHVTGGLTLPRLKEICAASGLLSPGRARALLLYLRYLGYVEAAGRDHNRLARYVPTQAFLDAWRRHFHAALEAARIVEPAVALVLHRLEEPAILEAIARFQGEEFLAATRGSSAIDTPYFRVFLNRHAGTQIIMYFGAEGTEAFPTRDAIPFSAASIARRFRVSRIHIKRMLDHAQREGFLSRQGDGAIVLEESLRAGIRESYAMQLARLLSQAARTVRETPELAAGERRPRPDAATPDREALAATA
jgi:hypothetical protein